MMEMESIEEIGRKSSVHENLELFPIVVGLSK
jgi:hypothetical protein